MFEVEKKISLTIKQLEELKKKSLFIEKQIIEDIYYDNNDYLLTLSNKWLRKRQNKYELKIGPRFNQEINHFEEIDDEEKIKNILQLNPSLNLNTSLPKANIFPFCSYTTHREKYKLDEFTIDLDIADFGNLTYQIAEIELLVSKKEEMLDAEKKIIRKLDELGIVSLKPIESKLSYFLMKTNPEHYQKLIQSKVFFK
jgi:adenylate cyclase class IV